MKFLSMEIARNYDNQTKRQVAILGSKQETLEISQKVAMSDNRKENPTFFACMICLWITFGAWAACMVLYLYSGLNISAHAQNL